MELVTVVHPDRFEYISGEIEKAFKEGDRVKLDFYNRLLHVSLEQEQEPVISERYEYKNEEDYSYSPEDFDQDFEWQDWNYQDEMVQDKNARFDFIQAVKAEYLGSLDIQFNASDLASIAGEMDISDYGIEDLNGLAYCEGLTTLNLTHNRISNIHDISSLHNLKELYLGENNINNIDPLGSLDHLEIFRYIRQ